MDLKHVLHQLMVGPPLPTKRYYVLCHPFVPATCKLLHELSKLSIRAAQWTDNNWDAKYSEGQSELRLFVQYQVIWHGSTQTCLGTT